MQFSADKEFDKHFPRRETVLLHFNKSDSEIARNWSKPLPGKEMLDDKK